jgi:hypothetical protein
MVLFTTTAGVAELGSGGSQTRAPPPDATRTTNSGTVVRHANAAPTMIGSRATSARPFYSGLDLAYAGWGVGGG